MFNHAGYTDFQDEVPTITETYETIAETDRKWREARKCETIPASYESPENQSIN